jgi:ABC-type multidrug transport system ATPase subunit
MVYWRSRASPANPPMIQVDHLTKRYGLITAVSDVSFNVDKGQIVGFLGPNGAGKSTTMKILSCFMPASGGTARVAGFDVFSQSMEVRRRIGYLPENAPLYGDLAVGSYLEFVAEIKGVPRGRDVRGEVVQLVAARGWRLLELHQVGMSLEEVFIRVVAGEEHGEIAATEALAAPAAGAPA